MASAPHVDVDEAAVLSKVQTIDEKNDVKQAYARDSTDEVIDASLLPTEEETYTLRRVSDSIPMVAWTIVFVEFAERFSWYGTTGPMTNYIQQPLPPGSIAGNVIHGANNVAGALGRGQRTSTTLASFRQFWTYFTPIIGAIVADVYLGRFKAIVVFFIICLVGHVLLIFVSIPSAIQHPNGALAGFVISLVIMGLGTGGFKSNISPLVAEQYRGKLHKRTLPSGETVLVDPTLTVQRTFLYFYMMINCGSLLSLTTTFAEKHVGFWLAYALPTFVFLLIPPVLVWGNKRYHKTPPRGSVLLESWRVFCLAACGKWSANPVALYRNFTHPDFWNAAKPSFYQGKGGESAAGAGAVPAAITWDDKFADEVMRALKACKVFAFYPLYWISYDQMTSNLTSQAATMVLNGVPNEIVNNLNPLSLVIMIPIMERIVYPGLRRMKINFTPIKRITFGFFLASMAMVYTTVIQYYIYKKGPCGKFASDCKDPAPLNVWLQAPSYIIIGLSEIFASITGLEYAFTKAPEHMKSVVMSVFLFMSALASAIEFGLVGVSTGPYLTWMYAGVGITSFVAGIAFWFTVIAL